MSTLILMKILESAPGRYDRGIRMLLGARLETAYDRLVEHIQPGQIILDLGCGTGTLTIRAARRGATVRGIDLSPRMLAIARQKIRGCDLEESITLEEKGIAELTNEPPARYDAITAGLCLSELSSDELAFTLRQAWRLLKPGGIMLIADEVRPSNLLKRGLVSIGRLPLKLLTRLVTQTSTRALKTPEQQLQAAGFCIRSIRSGFWNTLAEIVVYKPPEADR